jgi:hypothetical protein
VSVTVTANIVVAVLGVLAALAQTRRNRGGGRAQLRQDVDLYNSLPPESSSRGKLLGHIDQQIERLITSEDELTRDPVGICLGIIILLIGLVLFVAAFREAGLWWLLLVPAIFFAILGAVGLGQDLPRRKRDERGRVIRGEHRDGKASQTIVVESVASGAGTSNPERLPAEENEPKERSTR